MAKIKFTHPDETIKKSTKEVKFKNKKLIVTLSSLVIIELGVIIFLLMHNI